MNKKRESVFLVAIILFSVIALGCITEEEEKETLILTTAAPEYPKEIKIGCLSPLTDALAASGAEQKMAIEFAAWIVNNSIDSPILMARSEGLENLEGAKVVSVFGDGGCSAELAQQAAESLITRNPDLVALYGEEYSSAT